MMTSKYQGRSKGAVCEAHDLNITAGSHNADTKLLTDSYRYFRSTE